MSKSIHEAPLTTRAARSRLAPGVHWRSLDASVHIGYRKGVRAGRWLVRWRQGRGYGQATLATADDILEADGETTLSFDQAARTARNHVQKMRTEAAALAHGPALTVAGACDAYSDAIEARQAAAGRRLTKDCRSRFKSHVHSDDLAKIHLHVLAAADLMGWRERMRKKKLSPATLKRVNNDLRAALNEAVRADTKHALPDRLVLEIKAGFVPMAVDRFAQSTTSNIILPDADIRRLISAVREVDAEEQWDGDFTRLVIALAATGARYSQLVRCKVGDLHIATKRLMVPVSRKGRGLKTATHTAVAIGDDVIEAIRPAIAGRRGHEVLFLRWGYKRAGRLKWERDKRRPWLESEITDPFKAAVVKAGLSGDVTSYALRHSSIVRGLRAGLPVRLVASLHDTSSEMIERHYSAFIVDAMTEAARAAIVPLAETADIRPIRDIA